MYIYSEFVVDDHETTAYIKFNRSCIFGGILFILGASGFSNLLVKICSRYPLGPRPASSGPPLCNQRSSQIHSWKMPNSCPFCPFLVAMCILYLYYVHIYIYIIYIYTYTLSYVNDVTPNLMWALVLLETGDRWSLPVLFTSLVTCLARVAHFKEVNVSWGLDFWNFLFLGGSPVMV